MLATSAVQPTYLCDPFKYAHDCRRGKLAARSTFFIWPVFRRHSPNYCRQKRPGLLASLTRG
jgi:hypothetical protein